MKCGMSPRKTVMPEIAEEDSENNFSSFFNFNLVTRVETFFFSEKKTFHFSSFHFHKSEINLFFIHFHPLAHRLYQICETTRSLDLEAFYCYTGKVFLGFNFLAPILSHNFHNLQIILSIF